MFYGGLLFRPVTTEGVSDTSNETIFKYEQHDNLLTGTYSGGNIHYGHLIGLVSDTGEIDMAYHHIDKAGVLKTGVCQSTPEIMENGKIRLHERWQWTSGDRSTGTSIIQEM